MSDNSGAAGAATPSAQPSAAVPQPRVSAPETPSSVFVVPDAHGNHSLVLGLLEQERIVDSEGERVVESEVQVVQLGDLASCVARSIEDDLRSLSLVGPVIDFMLVGNHEHPYFGGSPFLGFWPDAQVKRALQRLHDFELIRPAHAVDGILLTHAGVAQDIVLRDDPDAEQWARRLNEVWLQDPRHSLFSMIGQERGGRSRSGGILWSDWKESRSLSVAQIFGHTVGSTWRARWAKNGQPSFQLYRPYLDATPAAASSLCLDVGAGYGARKILGCWIEEGAVRIVEHRARR